MRRIRLGLFLMIFAAGCAGSPPESDPIVPIAEVPSNVVATAKKTLPGISFDTVYKMKMKNGKDAYEFRGKDNRGKVREVEVSVDGEVLEIE